MEERQIILKVLRLLQKSPDPLIVILSVAKNLFFSTRYRILHYVQDDKKPLFCKRLSY